MMGLYGYHVLSGGMACCWSIFLLCVLTTTVVVVGIPRFAVLQETQDIIYISSRNFYRNIPDDFTLDYITNGLTRDKLTTISVSILTGQGYRKELDISSASIVRNWDEATNRITSKLLLLQDEPSLLQNNFFIERLCNPSLTYFQNRFLFAARREDWKPIVVFAWLKSRSSNSADFVIDQENSYLGIGPGVTELTSVDGFDGKGEDPRILNINDNVMLMIRTDISNVPFRLRLSFFEFVKGDQKRNQPDRLKLLNDTELQPPNYEENRKKLQKNWTPFLSLNREVHFVYAMHERFTIIRQDAQRVGFMEIVSDVPLDGKVPALWQYGQARGGSPARLLGKTRYLAFFHSRLTTPNTANWFSLYMGAYMFTSSMPYDIIAMSRVPFCEEGWYDGPWMGSYNTLYVYFAVNFYYVELSSGKILEDIHVDSCESLECMQQYNVTLSYGFNDKQGFIGTINLGTLYHTMHFFDSGDILKHYADVSGLLGTRNDKKDDIGGNLNYVLKKCTAELLTCSSDLNPSREGFGIVNTPWDTPRQFQIAVQPQQQEKGNDKHQTLNGRLKDVDQSLTEKTSVWKLIDWHFKWVRIQKSIEKSSMQCFDIGAKLGVFSFLMAHHGCRVESFESKQHFVESLKISTCLNQFNEKVRIHRTALSDGERTIISESRVAHHYPSGDECVSYNGISKNKYIPLIRIDTDGWEVRNILGLRDIIRNSTVESMIIDVFPHLWTKSNLTLVQGFDILHNLLPEFFSSYLLVGKEGCPREVLDSEWKQQVVMDDIALAHVPWSYWPVVLENIKHRVYNRCSFFLLRHFDSLAKRLEISSFD